MAKNSAGNASWTSSEGIDEARVSEGAKRTANRRTPVVAYLRVSTDRQAERGLGMEVQEQAVRAWARANSHRVVAVHRDEGVSGSNGLEERKGLYAAVEDVKQGRATGLLVARLDRIARTLTIQEAVLGTVWAAGGRVYTADGGEVPQDDAEDPYKTFVRQVMGAAAQLEKGLIAARMRAGRRAKAEAGGYAYGAPAFGYRADDRELTRDSEEQETLARILQLHQDNASLREIMDVLHEEGRRPKRGDRWYPQTVARALTRARGSLTQRPRATA